MTLYQIEYVYTDRSDATTCQDILDSDEKNMTKQRADVLLALSYPLEQRKGIRVTKVTQVDDSGRTIREVP